MRLYNKSLFISDNNIIFDENNIVNNYKSNLYEENNNLSSNAIKYNASDIGEDFLISFIKDNYFFSIIKEYFLSNSCPMSISILNGNKIDNYYLYKKNFINTLKDINVIDNLMISRINELISIISYDILKEKNINRRYAVKVNNDYVNFPYEYIFKILDSSDEEFHNFFKYNNEYYGYDKSMVLYIINNFYKDYSEGYLLSSKIKDRIKYINDQTDIEFVVYSNFTSTEKNSEYYNVNIDKKLKEEILSNMPKNLNKLEIAIFIYIKLCKLFNFDLEYYINKTKVPSYIKGNNMNEIKDINLLNLNVVCYQFNTIFAKLLSEYDIDFEIKHSTGNQGIYHAWTKVKIDNILISFDFAHKIFGQLDLLEAKLNNPLKGIKLYNKNSNVVNEFNGSLNKIYSYINKDIKNINNSYDDIINSLDKNFNIDEIIKYLVNLVENKNLKEIESIGFLVILINKLSKKYNIEHVYLINNIGNELQLLLLLILKKENNYDYYIYNPSYSLKRVDNETLEFYLKNNMYEMVDKNRTISGIDFVSPKDYEVLGNRRF